MDKLTGTLSPRQILSLNNQIFSDDRPGTLLKDFATLLDFIGPKGIPVSGKQHLLPIKALPHLNQLMSKPLDVKLKRPVQKSFPHIDGLFLLLRASGLSYILVDKNVTKLMLDTDILTDWQTLNPTERYFALLQAWWLHSNGVRRDEFNKSQNFYSGLMFFWGELGGKPHGVKATHLDVGYLRYVPGFLNLALMELFGFIRITLAADLKGETWPIIDLEPSGWGRVLLNSLPESMMLLGEVLSAVPDDQGKPWRSDWHSELKTHIPSWEKDLRQPETQTLQNGFCIFKISLGPAYCKLAVPACATLDDLANGILSTFAFDNDHLYEFIYKNRYGLEERVSHPYQNSWPSTEDCTVGELPLYKGMELAFHFDFGDDWWFQLVVETLTDNDGRYLKTTLLEQHGTPPKQYRDWDDE